MKKWNSKKISIVSILIAMSIAFVIIGTTTLPFMALPNLKLSLAGLPIKIIGFVFGPMVGFFSGVMTDIISFLYVPVFYNIFYTLSLAMSGMIPGIIKIIFDKVQNIKSVEYKTKKLNNFKNNLLQKKEDINLTQQEIIKINTEVNKIDFKLSQMKKDDNNGNKNYLLTLTIVLTVITFLIFTAIIMMIPNNELPDDNFLKFLKDKTSYILFMGGGFLIVSAFITFMKFKSKTQTFVSLSTIISFVVLTEIISLPLVALADHFTLNVSFITSFIPSLITSPFKVWGNIIIIFFSMKIVLPIIKKKEKNDY